MLQCQPSSLDWKWIFINSDVVLGSPADSIDCCSAQKSFCLSDWSVMNGWQNSSLVQILIHTLTDTITEHAMIHAVLLCRSRNKFSLSSQIQEQFVMMIFTNIFFQSFVISGWVTHAWNHNKLAVKSIFCTFGLFTKYFNITTLFSD